MDDIQHQGVLRKVGHQLLLQRLGAIGERHALLDVGPIALGHPLRQPAHGHRLARQGGPQFFADGPRAGRRLRAGSGSCSRAATTSWGVRW